MVNLLKLRAIPLLRNLGLDRAIAASSLTQLLRIITGPITMILIIRHLTPEEQGFFYSFAGVLGMQVFLEAGFAQSITQFSSREFGSLRFNNRNLLTGKPAALSRIRSIVQKASRYYIYMASILTVSLAVGGYYFFSLKPDHGVSWVGSWLVVSLCAGVGFLLTPFWAVLEGCNRVAEISTYRLLSTLVGFSASAIGLSLGLGIQVTAWASIISVLFPFAYLGRYWLPFIRQILRPATKEQISWGAEIWGFQWRIAATWGLKYMLFPMTPALAFALSGPVAAGQVGLCYQLAFTGSVLGTVWTVTKLPYWGTLLAQDKTQEFKSAWKTASFKHIGVVIITQLATLAAIWGIHLTGADFSKRFLSPLAFGGFALGIFFHSFWLIYSHYFRAKRQEPFVLITGIAAAIYIGTAWITSSYGDLSITYSFALANLFGGAASYFIWKKIG